MAVRMRFTQEIIYGHYPKFAEAAQALAELASKRGWAPGAMWMPVGGKNNIIVYEAEYDSLAEYEREASAIQGDAEFMATFREMGSHVVQGSAHTELFVSAPPST